MVISPQFLPESGGLASGLNKLMQGLAPGLQQAGQINLQQRQQQQERQRQQQYGTILGQALGQLPENASPMQITQALNTALEQGVPIEMVAQYGKTIQGLQPPSQKPQTQKIDQSDKTTYKENVKLLANIQQDARKVSSLANEADNLLKAIESKRYPGKGILAPLKEGWWNFWGQFPKEMQLIKSMTKQSLLAMGDLKGIRLTDAKLRFMQDNLFNENKSEEENLEAFRLWKDTIGQYRKYADNARGLIESDENALYNPLFGNLIEENMGETSPAQESSVQQTAPSTPKKGAKRRNKRTSKVQIWTGEDWKDVK